MAKIVVQNDILAIKNIYLMHVKYALECLRSRYYKRLIDNPTQKNPFYERILETKLTESYPTIVNKVHDNLVVEMSVGYDDERVKSILHEVKKFYLENPIEWK